jgi:hypothetical protein
MKFALITIIRNEQDILNTFLNHVDALFDDIFLVNHRSLDHSSSILKSAVKQRKSWFYITLDIEGYYQKEASALLMHHAFSRNADFVFFLDCDEFIQVKNREELEQKVEGLNAPATAGSLRWINCVTDKLDRPLFKYRSTIWMSLEPSKFSKVIITRSLYEKYGGNISLCQGNHQVIDPGGNFMAASEIGHLLHLPIRSRQQLINKTIRSALSNLSRLNRLPDENYQFDEMLKLIAKGELSDDDVRGCVYLYQNEAKIISIPKRDFMKTHQKTSLSDLRIASTKNFSFVNPRNSSHSLEQIVADHILSIANETPENLEFDEKEGRIIIGK